MAHKKEILVCDFAEWMPYVGHNDSETFGIVYDYFQAFGSKIGIPVRFVRAPGTVDCAQKVAEGEADAVASIDNVPNTYKHIVSSESYGEDFLSLVTNIETPFITSIQSIEGESLAVLKHYKNLHAYLRKAYPNLKLIYVDTIKEGFEKVAKGEIYGIINIYRVAAYTIRREYVGVLKINTKVGQLITHAHIGLSSDNEILKNIFNKAIASLSYEEKQLMIDRWMRAEHIVDRNYKLLTGLIVIFLSILLFLLYRQYQERKRQKELLSKQAKLAGMGTMINNIAHQWRQPLHRINSNIAVMNTIMDSEKHDSEMFKKKMSNIKKNTKYMSDTIEDFIHFFHPNKVPETFLVEGMVSRSLDLMGSRIQGIGVDVACSNSIYIHAFENELQQVILIILHNAVDHFMDKNIKDPKINIIIKEVNNSVIIAIEDNGGGIVDMDIEKIFEPYYTTKFVNEGTGLGLYMAKMLVESSMNGHLRVYNTKQGAYFEIAIAKGESHA